MPRLRQLCQRGQKAALGPQRGKSSQTAPVKISESTMIPLSSHPSVRLQGLRLAESFIETTLKARIQKLPKLDTQIHVLANQYALKQSDAWFCSYGAPIDIHFPESDLFRIQLHHKGSGSTKIGKNQYGVTPDQAVISYASSEIRFGEHYEQKVLRFSRKGLIQKIVSFTGNPLSRSLEFNPTLNMHLPQAINFVRTANYFMHQVNSQTDVPSLVLHDIEQMLISSFICSCPNNYTALLERQAATIAPAEVCRIEDYIVANWDNPISIEELVAVGGASARSIFRAFRESRGYSPMTFVKLVRLKHAKEMLSQRHVRSVADVALTCGFSDLGRFSATYEKMFGELPSETLRQTRRIYLQ